MWDRRAEFIIEKFHPKTVLDVGCAYGELVKALVDRGIDAYGIDGSDFAISKSDPQIRNRLFKVNLNSDKFPFEDKMFDVVGSFYSVEHIHNIDFFSAELRRTLKDSGIAWFLTPNEDEKGRNDRDVFTNTFEGWKKIFAERNFLVSEFSPHEMMGLKGKLGKFRFYKLPISLQNIIKKIAYNYANRRMNDTSFILSKS